MNAGDVFQLAAVGLLSASGCVTVTTVNVAQKTTLERQLMGDLAVLDEEEILAASVRASEPQSNGREQYLDAVAARQVQFFFADDVKLLLKRGCVGEGSEARLISRQCDVPPAVIDIEHVMTSENRARKSVLNWVLSYSKVAGRMNREEVVEVYRQALSDQAPVGSWIQNGSEWVRKSE